ncbi:MAG TPA: PEGA domain-containing protein [Vicinamibacterales bacterium]|nr:PEGA domain-containing protein [Vicinamibacterales bacterium]
MSRRQNIASAALVLVSAVLVASPAPAQVQTPDPAVLMSQAKQFFEALDYEHAVSALDQAIVVLEGRPLQDPVRRSLPVAYEMRGRSQFGLGKEAETRADFVSLLKVDPVYTLTGQVHPKVVSIFDEVMKATVTTMKLTVTPPTAEVRVDGVLVPTTTSMPIAVGDHTIAARQIGYRAVTQAASVVSGQVAEVAIALERVSSVLAVVTSPPGVQVIIDGVSHGKTEAGPPPPDYAERAARAGVPASELSQVMMIAEMQPGAHVVEFKADCHVSTQRRLTVDKPDDYTFDPVKLERAIAAVNVRTTQQGAAVYVDGKQRGMAPMTLSDVCEGDHVVEVRSGSGRYFRRLSAHTGDKLEMDATLKPAFALVSASGQATGLNTDLRMTIERAFEGLQTVTLFAPPADQLDQLLKAQQLTPAWLAFDASKRALAQSADLGAATRRDLTARIAKAFDAQGVASVTVPSALDRSRIVVSLLAAGSGDPDVVEVTIDRPETFAAAVAQVDRAPTFFRPSLGLSAIDVRDVAGAIVIGVDANGPAAKAGVAAGDVIVKANAQPIADAVALNALLASRKSGEALTLELKDRSGTAKRADVTVAMAARLVGLYDQTLLVNRMLLDLRNRLQTPGTPLEDSVLRLNLGAALARIENWNEARTELQRVKLPDGPGVSNGTVQYLLGLCADKLGSRADADAAFTAAAASDALISEDGPSVKDLVEARKAGRLR